ncbi:MAG: hypothetical protein ABSG33_09200 [Candidatus Bathyarchaeia archaeon]
MRRTLRKNTLTTVFLACLLLTSVFSLVHAQVGNGIQIGYGWNTAASPTPTPTPTEMPQPTVTANLTGTPTPIQHATPSPTPKNNTSNIPEYPSMTGLAAVLIIVALGTLLLKAKQKKTQS